jgi:hypothetical protein
MRSGSVVAALKPMPRHGMLARLVARRAERAAARPVGIRAPHAEHAEPALGEPQRRAQALLGRRDRNREGRHHARDPSAEAVKAATSGVYQAALKPHAVQLTKIVLAESPAGP